MVTNISITYYVATFLDASEHNVADRINEKNTGNSSYFNLKTATSGQPLFEEAMRLLEEGDSRKSDRILYVNILNDFNLRNVITKDSVYTIVPKRRIIKHLLYRKYPSSMKCHSTCEYPLG